MKRTGTWAVFLLLLAGVVLPPAVSAQASAAKMERAAWLLQRADWELSSVTGLAPQRDDFGGGGTAGERAYGTEGPRGVPILLSMLLPGAGEAYMGYTRGYFMMALDIASWIGVKHYHDQGNEKKDAYYVFAEAHWSEQRLGYAFDPTWPDPNLGGVGIEYFDGVTSVEELPLWVSREDDEREYFENLGKWDQFVFGWEDFQNPQGLPGYDAEGGLANLSLPGISNMREEYRDMREDSNDQFTKRDRLLYFNIATRVVSIFQVAYLQGLLGGGQKSELRVAGHPVSIIAEPRGFTGSRIGLAVAY